MIPAIICAVIVWTALPHQLPGTFQAMQDRASIVRMDTRSGTFERCTADGAALKCEPVVAK